MMRNNNDEIDSFFYENVYNYFSRGGHFVICVENVLNILTLGITLYFIIFIIFYVNWKKINECETEDTCYEIGDYIINPYTYHNTSTITLMCLFVVSFMSYWLWITYVLVIEIIKFLKYKRYFRNIGIKTHEIKLLSWLNVINKMIEYNSSLTHEIIVGSIMKKDNYLIAIIGLNLLEIDTIYYTQNFLWLINVVILGQIFQKFKDNSNNINSNNIVKILRLLVVFHIIFLPFILIITIINYIVNITTDFYTKKTYIGLKEWTIYARFLFREFNELPHVFNQRIFNSYEHAIQYEKKFNTHLTNVLMEKLIYILGICLSILMTLTFYNETIVLYIKLFDRSLVFYVTIIVTIISIARMSIVDTMTVTKSSEEIMIDISEHTHYFPEHWKNKCHTSNVLQDYKKIFKYKLLNILYEILSIFYIPYYIMTDKFVDGVDKIIAFIDDNTIYSENIGYTCSVGFSINLNIYSSNEDKNNFEYAQLIDNPKSELSIVNFNKYYKKN
jgi:hypothetical protein